MNIERKKVETLRITDIEGLDPVTVMLENFEPGKGKITIECYGESWSTYWGSMGCDTVEAFFCSCDEHYIAKNLSSIDSDVIDVEATINQLKKIVIEQRKTGLIEKREARKQIIEIEEIENPHDWIRWGGDSVNELLGCEPWHFDFPTKPNHHYEYLCRIINTVKRALREAFPCNQ